MDSESCSPVWLWERTVLLIVPRSILQKHWRGHNEHYWERLTCWWWTTGSSLVPVPISARLPAHGETVAVWRRCTAQKSSDYACSGTCSAPGPWTDWAHLLYSVVECWAASTTGARTSVAPNQPAWIFLIWETSSTFAPQSRSLPRAWWCNTLCAHDKPPPPAPARTLPAEDALEQPAFDSLPAYLTATKGGGYPVPGPGHNRKHKFGWWVSWSTYRVQDVIIQFKYLNGAWRKGDYSLCRTIRTTLTWLISDDCTWLSSVMRHHCVSWQITKQSQ